MLLRRGTGKKLGGCAQCPEPLTQEGAFGSGAGGVSQGGGEGRRAPFCGGSLWQLSLACREWGCSDSVGGGGKKLLPWTPH